MASTAVPNITNSVSQSSSTSTSIIWDSRVELGLIAQAPCTEDTESGASSVEDGQRNPPRADGGREAWLFLGGCFVLEALVWGKFAESFIPTCSDQTEILTLT